MLTLQFIPYSEVEPLETSLRIHHLLDIVKQDKIVLLEGKLETEEETALLEQTLEGINHKFKGIELSYLEAHPENEALLQKIRHTLVHLLLGNREGFTVIGPANVIKEIKRDPHKIQLLTNEHKKR
ncbi:MAG: DUF2073 domain-containing protein [Nanoarchaeota archaeon]